MLNTKSKNNLTKLFKSINKDDEFEIMFNNYRRDNKLSIVDWNKVLKFMRWRHDNEGLKLTKKTTLDIVYNYEDNNSYRISISGNDKINEILNLIHERKNHAGFSILITQFLQNDNDITLIKKVKERKHIYDIDEYDIRVRKSKEVPVDNKFKNNLANLPFSESEKISYRYKNRITLELSKNDPLNLDLTIVKSSNDPNKLQSSNKSYEMEIDYSPNKVNSSVLKKIMSEMETIKKVMEESDIIMSKDDGNNIINKYKEVIYGSVNNNYNYLYSMQPISAEVQHIVDNIPNKYSVTDKADGEKQQLFIYNDELYLLSNNLTIKKVNKKVKGLNKTIMEGELIYLTNVRKYIFMSFDCLFYKGKDIRNISDLQERLKISKDICREMGFNIYNDKLYSNNFDINKMRDFYQKEIENFYDHLDSEVSKIKVNDILFHPKLFLFPNGGDNSEVFIFADLIWTNCTENNKINCPYNLDGIIFTAAKNQIYTKDRREHKLPTYKYKPPSHNSLDLYVVFEKNKDTGEYLEIFDNSLPDQIENQYFRILNFFVGDSIGNKEVPVPFLPYEDNNVAFFPIDRGEVRDVEGNLIQDKTVIEVTYNNDPIIPHQYRWSILRTRWDKTEAIRRDGKKYGNYKDVAIKTWRAMREAVNIEEIRNLANPDNYNSQRSILGSRVDKSVISADRKQDKYYQKISNLGKEFRAFHNWFKSSLVYMYCGKEKEGKNGKIRKRDVLDIGCGRGGDFLKYYSARVGFYVGIDPDYEGLNSTTNGAIGRYNEHKKKYPDFTNMVFIQSDAAIPLNSNSQEKKFPNLSSKDKNNIDKIFTKERKFDTITAMFSIHYLFKNDISVNNLIDNVKNYLKKDGYLVCTLFDPEKVEKLFDGKKSVTSSYTDDEGNKKKLFEIVKKYDKLVDKPGLPIDVYMGWISEDNVYLEEYMVTDKLLTDTMRKAGCVLVDSDGFSNVYNINKPWFHNVIQYEENPHNRKFYQNVSKFFHDMKGPSKDTRSWSFLFKYYIFQKIE